MLWVFLLLALAVLVIGSYTDLKTKEVPDWVNFGLIFAGVGIHAIQSAVEQSWGPVIYSGVGLGIGIGIAVMMYYLGQWGGGDAKMLMGLGAVLGFDFSLNSFFLSFIINAFILGAIYGLCYGIVLAVKNRQSFSKIFSKLHNKTTILRRILLGVAIAFLIFSIVLFYFRIIFPLMIFFVVLLVIIFYYLFLYAKTIEKCCMLRYVSPDKLTEGDWIAKEVKYKGKYITGPKDLGISKKQINLLKKLRIEKVLMKDGIPFVPSFLIAFVFTYFLGNVFFLLFSIL